VAASEAKKKKKKKWRAIMSSINEKYNRSVIKQRETNVMK